MYFSLGVGHSEMSCKFLELLGVFTFPHVKVFLFFLVSVVRGCV